MKRPYWLVLIWAMAVLAASAAPVVRQHWSRPTAPQGHNDFIDSWTRENYSRALDLLLPDRCASPIDARWLSCVRIVPPYKNETEYSLSVERRFDGTLSAKIVRPKVQSIYVQLRERKKEHPHASVSDLAKLIEIESRTGDQRRFPRLADLADKFENLRLSPVLSDEIMMDPTEYRFRIRSFAGETMELTLNGPGPDSAPRQPQTLVQWAESVRQILASAFH